MCFIIEDIDECKAIPKACGHGRCINTIGSFKCECGKGKVIDTNTNTCVGT